MKPNDESECEACGSGPRDRGEDGGLMRCPHCEGGKCTLCDMGDDTGCARCDDETN